MRNEIRRRHYSPNTERTYAYWVRQYILYHQKTHPKELGNEHIAEFLTHLATKKQVSGTTQTQALNALAFLYKQVLNLEIGDLDYLRNVRRFKNIPTVLSREEVKLILTQMRGTAYMMASLLYGAGLRVNECVTLRVQDIDLSLSTITVRNTKGQHARVVSIPKRLHEALSAHLLARKQLHIDDIYRGWGYVWLPNALSRKYPKADSSFSWQYVFPSTTARKDRQDQKTRRWHCSASTLQKALKQAVNRVGVNKRVTCHTLRHSYATHLLEAGTDIRTIQELMGHKDVRTTMIYTHVLRKEMRSVASPLDLL